MSNPPIAAQAEELRPCPFCGGRPTTETLPPIKTTGRSGNRYHVWCMSCFALMDSVASIDDAIKAWNTRAAPPEGMVMVPKKHMENLLEAVDYMHEQLIAYHNSQTEEGFPTDKDLLKDLEKINDERHQAHDFLMSALAAAEAPQEGE